MLVQCSQFRLRITAIANFAAFPQLCSVMQVDRKQEAEIFPEHSSSLVVRRKESVRGGLLILLIQYSGTRDESAEKNKEKEEKEEEDEKRCRR